MSKKKTKKRKIIKKIETIKKQPEEILYEEVIDDSWIYILLLSSLVVLVESLKTFTFTIFNNKLTYSVFIIPIIFMLINFIYKRFNMKRAVIAIFISDIVMFIFVFLVYFGMGKEFLLSNIIGEFISLIISGLLFLFINKYIIRKKNNILLFISNYLFSLIIFYMVYTIIYIKTMNFNTYWFSYLITICIQLVICIVMSIIDKKIINKNM